MSMFEKPQVKQVQVTREIPRESIEDWTKAILPTCLEVLESSLRGWEVDKDRLTLAKDIMKLRATIELKLPKSSSKEGEFLAALFSEEVQNNG